jgi:hypothetical protein
LEEALDLSSDRILNERMNTGPRILLYTFLSKMFNYFLPLFVSVEVSDAYVNVLSIILLFISVLVCS